MNVTEGLVFWRVLIPGTGVTGWVKEMHADGSLRFLDPARSHKVEEGETCETIAGDNGVVLEDLRFVNQFDDAICADLPVGNLIVLPN